MDEKSVPYIVYEGTMARMERTIHRLWVLAVLLIIFLVGSNIAWVAYNSQFDDVAITQDVDTGDGAAYVAGMGDVYGESTPNG